MNRAQSSAIRPYPLQSPRKEIEMKLTLSAAFAVALLTSGPAYPASDPDNSAAPPPKHDKAAPKADKEKAAAPKTHKDKAAAPQTAKDTTPAHTPPFHHQPPARSWDTTAD